MSHSCNIYNCRCFFVLSFALGPEPLSVDFRELLENERSNFHLVNTAVSYLGGVPAMINPEDMSNTIPNEKVKTFYPCPLELHDSGSIENHD